MSGPKNQLAITGATIIDGNGGKPIENGVIVIEGRRISAVGPHGTPVPAQAKTIDARGKFLIPGLMNANLHLMGDISIETLAYYSGRYEDIVAESAQVALKHGMTTVFDTWGPRRPIMNVRDRVREGKLTASRIFCAGNIIGFDGPYSPDFRAQALDVASAAFANRINAIWVENVGRHLMWQTPEGVAKEVAAYIRKGIDFIKYGANDHFPGAFLAFSPAAQEAMVREAHRAGITAQSHSTSVEGLRASIEAGCDLVTHCNVTGPVAIPDSTLELMAKKRTGAVIFPWTERGMKWIFDNVSEAEQTMWGVCNTNARNLIKAGTHLMLANDAMVRPQIWKIDPRSAKGWTGAPEGEDLGSMENGHFVWLKAMEELGASPMVMLQAATKNIAVAYRKDEELGTLEPGKYADLIILDRDPLASAANYRSINAIVKEGAVVDRGALPTNPIFTRPLDPPLPEEGDYVPFVSAQKFPMCPCMTGH